MKSNWKQSGKPYQSINHDGFKMTGYRNEESIYNRLKKIDFYKYVHKEESVLDIGCNLGAVCLKASKIGCSRIVGIDKTSIIDDAKIIQKQTRTNNIFYYSFNLSKDNLSELFKTIQGKFDHVLALAIMMYIPHRRFWKVIKHYAYKHFWFESNHHPRETKIITMLRKNLPSYKIIKKTIIKETDVTGKHLRLFCHLVNSSKIRK